jgi:putative tributyrin esterase
VDWVKRNQTILTPLHFDCGREDSLLASSRTLHAMLQESDIAHVYEEHDGGHTWEYWQTRVRSTLRFIPRLKDAQATSPSPRDTVR